MKYDGEVVWFDDSSGEGIIIDSFTKQTFYVHYSAIISKDKWKTLKSGQLVKFSLYTNLYMSQVSKCQVI